MGSRRVELIQLKIVLLAAMPSASVTIATKVKLGISHQSTNREVNIVEQNVEPYDTVTEVEAFSCCLRAAELDSCPAVRLFFAHALGL
jgi:hypothetical protein